MQFNVLKFIMSQELHAIGLLFSGENSGSEVRDPFHETCIKHQTSKKLVSKVDISSKSWNELKLFWLDMFSLLDSCDRYTRKQLSHYICITQLHIHICSRQRLLWRKTEHAKKVFTGLILENNNKIGITLFT